MVARLRHRPLSDEQLRAYWRSPDEPKNAPAAYLSSGHRRSEFLVELVGRHATADASILEIGCNAGRNLDHLYRGGFTNLSAIELGQEAVDLLRERHPHLASALVTVGPVEEEMPKLASASVDVVFTMAVLEHLPRSSEGVFGEIARVVRGVLITIEDEGHYSHRHFPRNYKRVFEARGLREIEAIHAPPELPRSFVARVFVHR